MRPTRLLVALAGTSLALATAVLPGARAQPASVALPEIGVTYTHASWPKACDGVVTGLLASYQGVRSGARVALAAMRASGIDSIRVLVWHYGHPPPGDGVNIPSEGGLVEPYRTNIRLFATDVRAAGFKSMIVEYGPQWTNNPLGNWRPDGVVDDIWDPTKFEENWQFVRQTRIVFKQYGPSEMWFDPMSEMAPSDYVRQVLGSRLDDYIAEMYRRYVTTFGAEDITSFVIGKSPPSETHERMTNLIADLRSTGLPMPRRFGVHPDQSSPDDLANLRELDAVLSEHGLDQPLMIGEMNAEGPEAREVARDIAEFASSTRRVVAQIYLWFWRFANEPHECTSPPYRADSYIRAFTGHAPPSTLTAVLHGRAVEIRTPYGQKATGLTAGSYRLLVTDRSRTGSIHLLGPRVDRSTGIERRGKVAWTVTLRPGFYTYGSDATPRRGWPYLTVMRPG